jgi:hypothetical protein
MAVTTPSRQALQAVPPVVGEIEPFLQEVVSHLEPVVSGPPEPPLAHAVARVPIPIRRTLRYAERRCEPRSTTVSAVS